MSHDTPIIIAIDPGTNGAGAISGFTSCGDTRILSIDKTQEWANTIAKEWGRPIQVFIERVQMWAADNDTPGKAMQMQRLFRQQAELSGYFRALGCEVVEVHPRTWQRYYPTPKGIGKTQRKALLRDQARELYPFNKVTLTNCDALLILHYAINHHKIKK